jgi:hypothetical protein
MDGHSVNRFARVVALLLVFVAFAGAAAFGGYLHGRGSRHTNGDAVAAEKAAAVRAAVKKAADAKGAADKVLRERIMARHVEVQRKQDLELMDRLLLREQQAGDRRAAAAFARGQSVGRALASGGAAPHPSRPPHRAAATAPAHAD